MSGLQRKTAGQDLGATALAQEKEELVMEWLKCPTCIYRHPFEVTDEHPCPNLNLSAEDCLALFDKDSILYEPLGPFKREEDKSIISS